MSLHLALIYPLNENRENLWTFTNQSIVGKFFEMQKTPTTDFRTDRQVEYLPFANYYKHTQTHPNSAICNSNKSEIVTKPILVK